AGQHCDGGIYNSMWNAQAVENSTKLVRQGAIDVGRDPDKIRVWTIAITACELPEEEMLTFVVRRMNTYLAFPGMYEAICNANGWDIHVLSKIREELQKNQGKKLSGLLGDENISRDLEVIKRTYDLYPRNWFDEGSIIGSA